MKEVFCALFLVIRLCQCAVTNNYHEFISATTDFSIPTTTGPIETVKKAWTLNNLPEINPIKNNLDDSSGSNKEKRCHHHELLQSVHKAMLKRREISQDMLKKKCQTCKESILCKVDNCSYCQTACIGVNDEEPLVKMEHRMLGDDTIALSSNDNRYFTIGAFENGPARKLILRLLNVKNADRVSRLIVLAEMKSKTVEKEAGDVPKKPLIIDTARVLSKSNNTKMEIQLHGVNDTISNDQMRIVTGVNVELDKAMELKKKNGEAHHLTPMEIEEAINKALAIIDATVDDPKVGSRHLENKEALPESREAFEKENMRFVTHPPPQLHRPLSDNQKIVSAKKPESNVDESLTDDLEDKLSKHVFAGKGSKVEELPIKKRKYTTKYMYGNADNADEPVGVTQSPSKDVASSKTENVKPIQLKTKQVPNKKKTKYHYTVDSDDVVGITELAPTDSSTKYESESETTTNSYEQYYKLLKIIREHLHELPDAEQTDIKKLIGSEARHTNGKSDVVVRMDNMKPIQTKMTDQEIEEASKKIDSKPLDDDQMLALVPPLYKRRPKLLPMRLNSYGNKHGKAINNKVVIVGDAQKNAEGNPNVGNAPSLIEADSNDKKRPTFIDPKLINMDALIQELRETPKGILEKTGSLINMLKPTKIVEGENNQVVGKEQKDMTETEKIAKQNVDGENEEEVGCSKSEEESIYPILIHHQLPSYGGGYGHKPDYYRESNDNDENIVSAKSDNNDAMPQKLKINDGTNKDGISQVTDTSIVGAQMDWKPNELVTESNVPNSHLFAKFVPDKKTAVIDHKYNIKDKPNNMYYVGDNVKLPVLMKQHKDGSYHVAVDVNKLCNCKDGNCTNVPSSTEHGTIAKDEMVKVKMPFPDPLKQRIDSNIKNNKKRDVEYIDRNINRNTLNNREIDISDEDDDIKYKSDNDNGYYYMDPILNRIQLAKKMLSWAKNIVTDGERQQI